MGNGSLRVFPLFPILYPEDNNFSFLWMDGLKEMATAARLKGFDFRN